MKTHLISTTYKFRTNKLSNLDFFIKDRKLSGDILVDREVENLNEYDQITIEVKLTFCRGL